MTSNSNTGNASEHDIFRTCYQCPHRKARCHSVCEGYSARVAKQQEIYKMRLAQCDEYAFKKEVASKVSKYCKSHCR